MDQSPAIPHIGRSLKEILQMYRFSYMYRYGYGPAGALRRSYSRTTAIPYRFIFS